MCHKRNLLCSISHYGLSSDLIQLEYMEHLASVRPSLGAKVCVHEIRQKLPLSADCILVMLSTHSLNHTDFPVNYSKYTVVSFSKP